MKLIIATCLLTLTHAAPPHAADLDSKNAKILIYNYKNDGLGGYNFTYVQSDGTEHNQIGKIVDGHIVVKGRYKFFGQDGFIYSVWYIADENGYQATSHRENLEKEEYQGQIPGVPYSMVMPDSPFPPSMPGSPFPPSLIASSLG